MREMRYLYLANRTLSSPLEALFTLLIFILSKDAGATAWQITLLACSKPIVSLFAFQASSLVIGRSDRIRVYLLAIQSIGCLPCLLFPWVENVWFYIASYALFTASQRAAFPAWNELLKGKIGTSQMASTIAKGSSLHYFLILSVPLLSSFWLDFDPVLWKYLFSAAASLQALNILLTLFLQPEPRSEIALVKTSPWKEGFKILAQRPDYARYLLMFFLGGAGLIAIQPILPIFVRDVLQLSYKELTLAISLCKGITFIGTAAIWARWSSRMSLYRLNGYVNAASCFFIAFLMLSDGYLGFLYLAFLLYGAMQAGCKISGNLSGPLFSKEKESTTSSLNLALVGIRGCICPVMAQLLFSYTNAFSCTGSRRDCFLHQLHRLLARPAKAPWGLWLLIYKQKSSGSMDGSFSNRSNRAIRTRCQRMIAECAFCNPALLKWTHARPLPRKKSPIFLV